MSASAVLRVRTKNWLVGFGAGRSQQSCQKGFLWCSGDWESQTGLEWDSGERRGRGAGIVKGSGEVGGEGLGGGRNNGRKTTGEGDWDWGAGVRARGRATSRPHPPGRGARGWGRGGEGRALAPRMEGLLYPKAQRSLHVVGLGYGPELGRLLDAEVGGSPGAASVLPVKWNLVPS